MTKDLFFETTFHKWVEKEEKVFLSGKRRYLHLDVRIPFNKRWQEQFKSIFENSIEKIGHHQFYPFIKADISTPRYKKTDLKDEKGKPKRITEDKNRPIAYAGHLDAFIYSWYSTYLTELYEPYMKKLGIYKNVLAYLEKDASNIEFSKEVFDYIALKGECAAMAFDISSFFDGLDHKILYKKWYEVLKIGHPELVNDRLPRDHYKVYDSLTNYTFVPKSFLDIRFKRRLKEAASRKKIINRYCTAEEFREKVRDKGHLLQNPFRNKIKTSKKRGIKCGIPQGSPISACLSNIYMIDFDIRLRDMLDSIGGLYRRYCDDIIVICETAKTETLKDFVLKTILDFELEINDRKTEITIFKRDSKGMRGYDLKKPEQLKNLQYLGFEFNGQNIYLRSASMSRYFKRMTARIRENLKAAYGNNSIGEKVFRKKLMNRYTDKGERNFHAYAIRAADIMNSETIAKQIKNNDKKVKDVFKKKKEKFEEQLKAKKKLKKNMR